MPNRIKAPISLAIVFALLGVSVGPAAAGPSPPNYSIPDGEWEGEMFASYLWDFSDQVSGVWNWGGDMHFISAAGELEGEAIIDGIGSGETDISYALGSVHALVAIFGASETPQFQAQSGALDIAVEISGFSTSLSFPLDASTSLVVPIELFVVTCSQVDGHWDAFMNAFASANGFTLTNLTTNFHAVRTADLSAEAADIYKEEMQELQERANQFLSNVKANSVIDANEFEDLLDDAEALSQALRKNNDCGYTEEWSFALPIAGIIVQLVDFVLQNPGSFTPADLFLIITAAVRTGAMGAGAVNPDIDADMRAKLTTLLEAKMQDIDQAGGNCAALQPLYLGALVVGGSALTTANSLYAAYGCS